MRYFLPKSSIKSINTAIEAVFSRLKGMFLFKKQEPKKIRFVVTGIDKPLPQREDMSLPGVFNAAAKSEGVKPDEKLLDIVQQSVAQYLDAQQELAKAKVQNVVQGYITEAELSPDEAMVDKELGERLSDVMEDITQHVTTTLDHELNRAKNVSSLSSISKVCAHIGIEDPTVVFLGPNDGNTCKDCKRLYFLKDGITPRAWKMSEISMGYGKHGADRPSIGGQHPKCRHWQVPMMPGYGFKGGKIAYMEPGYDVWEDQREG